MGLVVLRVLEEDLVHVSAGVLVQLVAGAEDDQGDLAVTQHGQLVSFLHHSEFSLVKRHLKTQNGKVWREPLFPFNANLSVSLVCYARYLYLLSAHLEKCQFLLLRISHLKKIDLYHNIIHSSLVIMQKRKG